MASPKFARNWPTAFYSCWANSISQAVGHWFFFTLMANPKFARNAPTTFYSCWTLSISPAVDHWTFLLLWLGPDLPEIDQQHFIVAGPSAFLQQWATEFFFPLMAGPKFPWNGPTPFYSCWALSISQAVGHWIFNSDGWPQICLKWTNNIL